jgi:hypothetical protein
VADRQARQIARAFHEAYEDLAPRYGYKTRMASRVPWDKVPPNNRALMEATAAKLLADGVISVMTSDKAVQAKRISDHGKKLDYEQQALDAIQRSWEVGDKDCMAIALADGQVWATLHLARMFHTTVVRDGAGGSVMADLAHASEGDTDLHGDPDARHWAERFASKFYVLRRDQIDSVVPGPEGKTAEFEEAGGLMLAWFAAAIETGKIAQLATDLKEIREFREAIPGRELPPGVTDGRTPNEIKCDEARRAVLGDALALLGENLDPGEVIRMIRSDTLPPGELEAELARARAAEDAELGRNVIHVMERYYQHAQDASPSDPEGTIMRATDTGREWVFSDGQWQDLR